MHRPSWASDSLSARRDWQLPVVCPPSPLPSPLAELSFRWMLNEFPFFIPLDKRRFVSQATGNLYISKVDRSDTGNYSCFVSSPSISKSVFSKFIPLVPLAERKYDSFVWDSFQYSTKPTITGCILNMLVKPPPLPTLIHLCCCFLLIFNDAEWCWCVPLNTKSHCGSIVEIGLRWCYYEFVNRWKWLNVHMDVSVPVCVFPLLIEFSTRQQRRRIN